MFDTMLTDAERERLAFLIEEMAEAIHMAGKALRHGLDSSHPDYKDVTNRANLTTELGHVCAAIDMVCGRGDISAGQMHSARMDKLRAVKRYMHFQPDGDVDLQ